MAYAKLNVNDLNKAIAQTKEAIQRSRDLLEAIVENPPTKVLQELADSTQELIKKLEKELKSLEKALEKKTSGK
jgi:rubrerythrin